MLSIITANGIWSKGNGLPWATTAGDGLATGAGEALGDGWARPGLGEAAAAAAGLGLPAADAASVDGVGVEVGPWHAVTQASRASATLPRSQRPTEHRHPPPSTHQYEGGTVTGSVT